MRRFLLRLGYVRAALKETLQFDNRWEIILAHILSKPGLTVYRYRGKELLVDRKAGDHAGGARLVLGSEEYKQFIRRFEIAGEARVLDLGAHVGSFPILLSSMGAKFDRLVCIELNPDTFQRLEFNIRRNLGEEPVVLNMAVAGGRGPVKFWQSGPSVGSSLYPDAGPEPPSAGEVEAMTLDDLYDRYFSPGWIDICKMDVEGAEFDLADSPYSQRLDRCRYLLMEMHTTASRPEAKLLEWIFGKGFREVPPTKTGLNEMRCFENENFKKELPAS